jgi:hypothetical protein
MRSPTARTLKFFRDLGALARVVEKYNSFSRRRIDLWGQDIQVIQGSKLIGVQSTSGTNHASRVTKSLANPEVKAWLNTGNGFEIYSWSQRVIRNADGSKSKLKRWMPRVSQLILEGDKVKVL